MTTQFKPDIGMMVRVIANGLGHLGSIPGRVIPKTQKMVLDASLLNTRHFKVLIKGKVEPTLLLLTQFNSQKTFVFQAIQFSQTISNNSV